MEAATDDESVALPQADGEAPQPHPAAESQSPGDEAKNEDDDLIEKALKLMEKITSSPDNPSPAVLHALASLLEIQEARYMEENDHFPNNGRGSHNIGKLGNLVQENDDFFELISSRYLSDTRFTMPVKAAAARLLLSVSLTWIYPDVFEDAILDNIKDWVMDESARFSSQNYNLRPDLGKNEASDSEMLKTYSTGLLAMCLSSGGQVVEDVLTSGLSAKLMRYLRMRVLGETGMSFKDTNHLTESKNVSSVSSLRGREEGRSRARQVLDITHVDDSKINDDRPVDDQGVGIKQDKNMGRQALDEECWVDDRELPDGFNNDVYDADAEGDDRWHSPELQDTKTKYGDVDERGRDVSKRRVNRGYGRSRGKGRINDGAAENEQVLTSPGSSSRLGLGRSNRDTSLSKNSDAKKASDSRKCCSRISLDGYSLEREDTDDCFRECRVGTKDISDLVKKAVSAAEAEARAANAPADAVRAAGDAAADVVKSAALEEFTSTSDEEAAVLAASKAASTVIDAANAVEVSRSSSGINADSTNPTGAETEVHEDVEEYFILDYETLAQLREKFCIQCLETLGEYVEVLGPVLHEKGVDVCLTLLQSSSKHKEPSKGTMLLPDVMKLICALGAHRKFAALFVDRGGMQKLLAVPWVAQTFFGLSSCLFTIGSLQVIMERVCALPSDIVYQVVGLAIELLKCSQDQARKNAALFFAAAFVFRAVLDAFDAQDGLQKLLGLLNDAASVRSGNNSGSLGFSGSGSLRNDRSLAEVLTSSEKQIAYHVCVALRQYFRAHLILLVDSIRPNKTNRSAVRSLPSSRAVYKPLDISNESIDAVFLQLQKDRKLGPAFVRTRWPAVEKFLGFNGHIIMLELCQAPPFERYLRDLLQYAFGILHIVTLVPYSRKMIVNATLSNDRVGVAVILDAANIGSTYVDPEIIQPALNVLVNLVCPPPSISNKPTLLTQGQQSAPTALNQHEQRERNGDQGLLGSNSAVGLQSSIGGTSQVPVPTTPSGLVGDRRITLGAGAGSAGLAAQLEQGYRQAREAVRANNGIKVLLHLLQPRVYTSPVALDCLRALACRVLLGLARDDAIAHILTKLQVGKKLSELIRDSGSQATGTEQGRWQAELAQVAIELIGIVTSAGRASTLAATDAATPTLRRIERAAIAAATPITYHSRELLQLMHEHLQASGLASTAATLLKEAQLTPLPLVAPSSLANQSSTQETSSVQIQWPSCRAPGGFLSTKGKLTVRDEESGMKHECMLSSVKKKPLVFSPSLALQSKSQQQSHDSQPVAIRKISGSAKLSSTPAGISGTSSEIVPRPNLDTESQCKTPIVLPMKRKLSEVKEIGSASFAKRLNTSEHGFRSPVCPTPNSVRRSSLLTDGCSTPNSNMRDQYGRLTPGGGLSDNLDENHSHIGQGTPSSQLGLLNDPQPNNVERLTLDSLVVQFLKHQHRQCPAPITTLPPLSLLHPHVCPEPKRSLDAPVNATARFATREFRSMYGGIHGNRKDRQFVYSRFKPWRTCRDDIGDASAPLTCITFLQDSNHIAVGTHSGELKIFDSINNSVLESCTSHQYPLTLVQSYLSGETQLVLSSSIQDVRLWDASSVSSGPMHSFEECKAAKFSNSGSNFAALSSESTQREILLYDVQTFQLDLKLSDTSTNATGRGHLYSLIHFSPSDTMLLWNGVLWDRRISGPVHRFDQFTDYGGGGFHPAGNEVIINSEVWDLRKFRLLRSVPSLDQTTISFNARGDVIYAILRRNIEDVMSVVNTRRAKHPLHAAFRTLDAINYSDITTFPVDRCVLDFATEATDSFAGLITMDDQDEMITSARVYEIGRRRPTDDDSDPDDAESEEDEEEDDDGDDDSLGRDLHIDIDDSDEDDMSHEDDSGTDEDGDFTMDDIDFDGGAGILEIVTDGDGDDDGSQVESYSSGDEDGFVGNDYEF